MASNNMAFIEHLKQQGSGDVLCFDPGQADGM